MRYKHPKAEMHANGIYGGIGTRPAHEPWTPPVHGAPEPEARVPERWRRIRLRRTRRRRMTADDDSDMPVIFVLGAIAVPLVLMYLMSFLFHFGLL